MLELLKNEIIVNWIAPIITGLIITGISSLIVKIFKDKRDEKIINTANERFVRTILPFIIQKIECEETYISDIRSVIVKESRLKDKYVYQEIELRNKLIMDISESKYINEENKKELIEFTYKIFKRYEKKEENKIKEEKPLKKNFNMITIILILLIVIAETMIIIINILDTGTVRPEENILYIIPLLLGIVSIMSGLIIIVLNSSESKLENIKKNNYESIYYNYINQKTRNNLREKNNKE